MILQADAGASGVRLRGGRGALVSYAGRGTGPGRGSQEDVAPPPDDREVVQGRRKRRVALWVGFNGQDYVGSQINRSASPPPAAPPYRTG